MTLLNDRTIKNDHSVVTPNLYDGNHEEPSINRRISLLPLVSKVCERVALNQSYLLGKVVIRKLKTTDTSLIRTTDAILKRLTRRKFPLLSYLIWARLSIQFSLNHGILLNKLLDIGISPHDQFLLDKCGHKFWVVWSSTRFIRRATRKYSWSP